MFNEATKQLYLVLKGLDYQCVFMNAVGSDEVLNEWNSCVKLSSRKKRGFEGTNFGDSVYTGSNVSVCLVLAAAQGVTQLSGGDDDAIK